ncbi:MAG: Gp138 family membrane-puncturing spike protein [Myxococcota bacterium]
MTVYEESDDLATVLEMFVQAGVNKMFIALPAVVTQYDPAEQCCSAKPTIKGQLGGKWYSLPVLPNIPVLWPQGGGMALTFPLKPGDYVLLVFCDRSIDEWMQFGGTDVQPQSPQRFDINDPIAIAGINPFNSALKSANATDMVLGEDEGSNPKQLRIGPEGISLGNGETQIGVTSDGKLVLGESETVAPNLGPAELVSIVDRLVTAIAPDALDTATKTDLLSRLSRIKA